MVLPKMYFERIIVDVVLLLPTPAVATVAYVATFVFVPAMCIKLIVSIEAFPAEATFRMTLEPALVDRTGVVVAKLLMFPKLREREELMFVSENFLISCTKIASFGQHTFISNVKTTKSMQSRILL